MLMEGFPPRPDALVTAANWQDPPFNRWAFWHTRELLPTQRIAAAATPPRPLVHRTKPIDVRVLPVDATGPPDRLTRTVGDVLDDTFTDAWLVLQDGEIVEEWYGDLGAVQRTHAVLSVTKSV